MLRLTAVLLCCSVSSVSAGELRLSVAASLADALTSRCAAFGGVMPGVRCVINSGASGTLARQIEQGAPADLFISANPQWLDYLVEKKILLRATVIPLVGNRLVFVGAPGTATKLQDLSQLRRIGLGNPANVPAGAYAEAALRRVGLYEPLLAAGQLVFAQDARQALVYAERGEVDGAFVYRSDAQRLPQLVTLFEVPAELYPAIVAPLALTASGDANPEVRAFWRYLQGPESAADFAVFGFIRP